MRNKVDYITSRYILNLNSHNRYINGYNVLKGKKIAKPFTALYPDLKKIVLKNH